VPWYRVPVFRDPDDNMLGGVVSGVSQAYGFDRRTTRLALVIAGLVLPIVVLVYVVAWILLPDGRDQAQPLEDIVRDKRRFPLYAALALLVLVGGIGSLGSWLVFGDFPWGVGLVAIGVLLWMAPGLRRDRRAARDQNVASATGSGPVPSGAWATPTSSTTDGAAATDARESTGGLHGIDGNDAPPTTVMPATADAGSATTSDWSTTSTWTTTATWPTTGADAPLGSTASDGSMLVPPPATPRRRRRIPVGSITLLAVLAFIGVTSAGDALGWWDTDVLGIAVASIAAMAVGLAISTIVNRAWFFVPVVAVLALAAGFLAVADPSLDGGAGDRTVRPTTVADAERVHELGLGELTLDLAEVPLDTDRPVRVVAEVGIGRLHVIVPAGAELVIDSDIGAGHVVIGNREVLEGVDQQDTLTAQSIGERAGTIELDLRVGLGEIDVDRDVFAIADTTGTTGTTD
jgi:phage shock protein PspC (stress-responsive transcriptional regulator)